MTSGLAEALGLAWEESPEWGSVAWTGLAALPWMMALARDGVGAMGSSPGMKNVSWDVWAGRGTCVWAQGP